MCWVPGGWWVGWFVLLFPHIAACINSDFDDDHDSPKGEVNPNVIVNSNDVSDIFKQVVDDKGVSSCLKSLWKTTLCKLYLSLWPPLNPVIYRRTISLMLWSIGAKCLDFAEDVWKLILQAPESPSSSSSEASLARATRPSSSTRR